MAQQSDIAEIKALLQARAISLVPQLVPDGYRSGRYWMAKNPTRADRNGGSFVVWMQGGAIGCFKDFAGDCEGPGARDKGDIIDLIQYVHGFAGMAETLGWARDYLGLAKMDAETKRKAVARAAQVARDADQNRDADLDRQRKSAFGMWVNSERDIAGTTADAYLRSRGIIFTQLAKPARALRFHRAMTHLETKTEWPCLIAGMYALDGTMIAVHRTWLARDGSGKAPVLPARKIWPAFRGGFIPIARGQSGLSHDKARDNGIADTLILTEGVEDALSVALACPDARVWAVGSLGNLMALTLPACATDVVVCADNDWSKLQAGRLLKTGLEALAAQGAKIAVARSPVGKDVNDALLSA